jgi:hypothetical protein
MLKSIFGSHNTPKLISLNLHLHVAALMAIMTSLKISFITCPHMLQLLCEKKESALLN